MTHAPTLDPAASPAAGPASPAGPVLDPVLDVHVVPGADAPAGAPLDLLIEIPHGATATADFTAVAALLTSALPESLVDFFHVNTDAGAPELGLAVAQAFVAAEPHRTAAVARCRVPRTFIDCNRRLDATADDFKAGKVTPGLPPWISTAQDRQLLRDAYDRYLAAVAALVTRLTASGKTLLLHSYAPRTVDVEVDDQIVKSLRRAYQPEIEPTWPLRPELDVIGRGPDGKDHTPPSVMAVLRPAMAELGLTVADSATYPLHPSTVAWSHVMDRPGRALCLEVRRDLLADPFAPFHEMNIGAAKVERLTGALVLALRAWT